MIRAILLSIVLSSLGCSSQTSDKKLTGIWHQNDTRQMAEFVGSTTSAPFYCLELNPEQKTVQVRFLDLPTDFNISLVRKGAEHFEMVFKDKARHFQTRPGANDGLYLHFADSSPYVHGTIGSYDGLKTDYKSLDECVRETLAQLEEDKRQASEQP